MSVGAWRMPFSSFGTVRPPPIGARRLARVLLRAVWSLSASLSPASAGFCGARFARLFGGVCIELRFNAYTFICAGGIQRAGPRETARLLLEFSGFLHSFPGRAWIFSTPRPAQSSPRRQPAAASSIPRQDREAPQQSAARARAAEPRRRADARKRPQRFPFGLITAIIETRRETLPLECSVISWACFAGSRNLQGKFRATPCPRSTQSLRVEFP